MLEALRCRQSGAPLWRIAWWDLPHLMCFTWFVPAYRHRGWGINHIPRTGPVLFVSNHQSFIDPIIVGLAAHSRQFCTLARANVFGVPVWTFLIRSLNAIPVNQNASDLTAMRRCIHELAKGQALLIFSEGGRTLDGQIGRFETGTMVLIKRVRRSVVPVAIEGAYDVWRRGHTLPRLSGRIGVMYGRPIPPEALLDRDPDQTLARLRDHIAQLSRKLSLRMAGNRDQ